MNILKTFSTIRSGSRKVFWKIVVPKMSKNIERSQIQAKSYENAYRSAFLAKLQVLNLKPCRKINFTTSIFQLIYLPFKDNCLSKKTLKKRVRVLKSKVYHDTQGVLLFM